MKKFLWIFALVAVVGFAACSMKVGSASHRGASTDPLVLRVHFTGTDQLFAAPEAAKLKEIWGLKTSAIFRDEVLNRFSILPSFWLGDALPKGASTQTNLFRPLLNDVLTHECYLDCNAAPEFVLAVRVPDDRARLWQTNLWQALSNWKLGPPASSKFDSFSGFELKRAALPGVVRCVRAGEWIVLSAGSGNSARETEILANIKATGRPAKPSGAWLDGDANLARFEGWLPALTNLENLPIAHFSLSNRADFVRTYATLDFPKPHGWKPEPWQIPTNVIHEPLISFVAMRGIGPVLDSFNPIRDLGFKPTPNQIIGWGYNAMPFQYNYAVPSKDARTQLKSIYPRLMELMGRKHMRLTGQLDLSTNGQDIIWSGLPAAVPHLTAFRDAGQDFFVLSCFPPFRGSNPPPQLYQAFMGRDEVVSFDFEITGLRTPHWRQFYQLAEKATTHPITFTNVPFQNWLFEAEPKLGEAVTELRSTSPRQMTLVRKSSLGVTAVELVTLGRWLESTNFPSYGVFLPTPPRPANRPAPKP